MNDNNKQNHTKAVREGLESLQNCQKQYTMKQISEQTDSKVTPEDVRSEIVKIINDEEGQLLYSPSCESSGICETLREKIQDIDINFNLISYETVLIGFGILGVLLTSAPLLGLLERLELLPLSGVLKTVLGFLGLLGVWASGGSGGSDVGWGAAADIRVSGAIITTVEWGILRHNRCISVFTSKYMLLNWGRQR